jgi:hypothetical protein
VLLQKEGQCIIFMNTLDQRGSEASGSFLQKRTKKPLPLKHLGGTSSAR